MLGKLLLAVISLSIGISPLFAQKVKTQYRGFTVHLMDKEPLTQAVRTWKINQVRYMMCPAWRTKSGPVTATWEKMLKDLPAALDNAQKLGLAVVIDLHHLPADNRKTYAKDANENEHLWWSDPDNLALLIKCWKQVAEICKERDQVIWFDLLNEPVDSLFVHKTPSYAPALPEWMQKTIDAIRTLDRRHPIVVEPGPGMLCWGFTGFPALKDPVMPVIYSVHMYQPVIYTHQGIHDPVIYPWPGRFNDHGGGFWDKKRLEEELAPAIEFQKLHHARIYVGEFSAARWAPNAADYLQDCIDIFEKYGWDWNYHAFNESAIWSLEESDYVDLCDKTGKYVKTGLADPKSGLQYSDYSLPQVGKLPKVEGFTGRRGVMKKAFDKNKLIRKLLVIGNSITQHAPSEGLGWPNDCGMAATSREKDFIHVLHQKLVKLQPQHKPVLEFAHIANEAAMTGFDALLPCNADLIVIELGDNYRGKANVEELQKPYEKMIADLKQGHTCKVFCVGAWGNAALNPFIKAAAEAQGATYVDIQNLFPDVKNRAASEGHFKNDGVNWHPGNRGMSEIAAAIWKAMRPQLK
jgi:hypothetical protein